MSAAYYNEFDPKAAAWLRELIAAGLIADGEVDERSITDVKPEDLVGFRQCHFFAGIGGWSYALRLAEWLDDRPVWTGSCPCQPFSAAGKQRGEADERHLWPAFWRLIGQCRPPVILGEQVASNLGYEWLTGVRADLEDAGYRVGAADLCAACGGAPHIRQRLWWVADTEHSDGRTESGIDGGAPGRDGLGRRGAVGGMGDAEGNGRQQGRSESGRCERTTETSCATGGVADCNEQGLQGRCIGGDGAQQRAAGAGGVGGHWDDSIWHPCRDGKARRIPVEPALFPLADGLPGRVGLLRGAGNAIVPQVAAVFIRAYCEATGGCK